MEATHARVSAPATFLFCVLVFFFNTFLMPQGLSLTLLLTPVWLYMLARERRTAGLAILIALLGVYAIIHLAGGANLYFYALSDSMLFGVAIFCIAVWPWLRDTKESEFDQLFRVLVALNFCFCLSSIPLLWIETLKPLTWYEMSMSEGIKVIPRLKLFTYEASHYSYMLAPLFIYFSVKALWYGLRGQLAYLFMIAVPLLLSLSFGALACLLFSGMIILIVFFKSIFHNRFRRLLLITMLFLLIAGLGLLWIYFPENVLFVRLQNMTEGKDTSFRGRTYESFILADKIVAAKSWLFGIGPGQLKLEGRTTIIQYYFYSIIPDVIRIPNACAETIVSFGYLGFALRILTEMWLAIRFRIYKSPFQLWLFLFLFFFQFAGSYITNWVEYLYWMLCFIPGLAAICNRQRQKGVKSPVS
jgi:hypothetical protein